MADKIPTTKELSDNLIASFEANFGQTIRLLKKAFLRVQAKVLGALFVILYKYAGFLGLQLFVSTASIKETEINGRILIPLVELGIEIGVGRPRPALAAKLQVQITVTTQVGSLASGTPLLSNDNGVTYVIEGVVQLDAAVVEAEIIAIADQQGGDGTGIIGNLEPGAIVSFVNPLANVAQDTIVLQTIRIGIEGEDLDTEYRARVGERRKNSPQGGALADYVIWGLAVNGIINIYPYTGSPGEVDVYSEATPQSSGDPDGIPTSEQLLEVEYSIQYDSITGLARRRPVSAFVNSLPISRIGFEVLVIGLIVEDIDVVRDEIELALTEYFLSLEPFITGISSNPRQDRVTLTAVGGVINNVVSAFGGLFEGAQVLRDGNEVIIYSLGEGIKTKLEQVTFV